MNAPSMKTLQFAKFSFDKAAEALFWVAADAHVVEVNEAACKSLQYSREELLKLSIPEIDPNVTLERWQGMMAHLRVAHSVKLETEHVDSQGRRFPVEVVGNLIVFEGEEFIFSSVRDISERAQAKQALLESEARFRALVEHATEAIVVFDLEAGRFVDFNENACRLFKVQREALLNLGPVDLSPRAQPDGRDSEAVIGERLKRAEMGESPRFEWVHRNAVGEEIPCEVNLTRLPSQKGVLIRGSITDVSHRKRMEAELQKAQKLESLGILAGGIAHDFNNLIGGLFGFLELAMDATQEPLVKRFLDEAVQSIDRARGLTQQLLTFARGGDPLKKVHALPRYLRDTVRFALSGSNVECVFDLHESLWPCAFDENQIAQVIDNLVINAKQAMGGGGTLWVKAENTVLHAGDHGSLEPGAYVRIAIRDQGPGISPAILGRIFDPFFTTKPNGQGLGLSTSYSIVNRHRGSLGVESMVGVGSTFVILLPASPDAKPESVKGLKAEHAGKGLFIVMDDNAAMRLTMCEMLAMAGYETLPAASGEEVLRIYGDLQARGQAISGLLFDLTIPGGMGGRDTLVAVRKLGLNVPAYVVSGYAEDDVVANPKAYGFAGSLRKPFLKAELMALLKTHSP